ncbi:MAG: hypothetical protein RTU30_09435 [Candidatus Thorarchaeota archaeon]
MPDPRVEKTALTMKKEGHELFFLGARPTRFQNLHAFDNVHWLPIGNDLDVALNPIIRRKWLQKIKQLNPDVIHAHNAIIAHFLLGTDYPAIYDDHEYWSHQVFKYAERKLPRGITSRPLMYLLPKWERGLLSNYPTLTTNELVAQEHRKFGGWVGVTRNVPTIEEVDELPNPSSRKGLVYVGNDFRLAQFTPHRNMTGLRDILDLDIIWGLTHREMMEQLTNYRIGLTPWRLHPFHKYCVPNKTYEYMHAGLQAVLNRAMKGQFQNEVYVHGFNNYHDVKQTIDAIPDVDPAEIMNHARKNYIWHSQERVILESYKRALN